MIGSGNEFNTSSSVSSGWAVAPCSPGPGALPARLRQQPCGGHLPFILFGLRGWTLGLGSLVPIEHQRTSLITPDGCERGQGVPRRTRGCNHRVSGFGFRSYELGFRARERKMSVSCFAGLARLVSHRVLQSHVTSQFRFHWFKPGYCNGYAPVRGQGISCTNYVQCSGQVLVLTQ